MVLPSNITQPIGSGSGGTPENDFSGQYSLKGVKTLGGSDVAFLEPELKEGEVGSRQFVTVIDGISYSKS